MSVVKAICYKRACISNALTNKIYIISRLTRTLSKKNSHINANRSSCSKRPIKICNCNVKNFMVPTRLLSMTWRPSRSKTKTCASLSRRKSLKNIGQKCQSNNFWRTKKTAFLSRKSSALGKSFKRCANVSRRVKACSNCKVKRPLRKIARRLSLLVSWAISANN